ncbi:MAG: hypothetical protein SFX73_19060 [Kofleriaceae bacterium]|nr:hypothetical protein [Kofleriaceae bacterium]
MAAHHIFEAWSHRDGMLGDVPQCIYRRRVPGAFRFAGGLFDHLPFHACDLASQLVEQSTMLGTVERHGCERFVQPVCRLVT